ncbi:MAG: alkaline phosphatase D family protein [Verrucomicrobia bacterium]|nr:alkaline phosphatase D family protein [Verrucomicrobiota bacterium]
MGSTRSTRKGIAAFFIFATVLAAQPVHQATGIKIVETTPTSAVVWTRLTRDADRAPDDGPLPVTHLFDRTTGKEIPLRDNATYANARPEITFPPGADLGSIRGAAIGATGETRVRYRAAGTASWSETAWRAVDAQRDFTATFALSALRPGARYEVEVEGRRDAKSVATSRVAGGFVTAPAADAAARVTFCVMTCQQYEDRDRPDGFEIYPAMLKLRPDFFVNTGDAVYYDHGPVHAVTVGLARYHWARMFGFDTLRQFHRQVGSYFLKDDHDVLTNDSEPGTRSGDLTFAEGLRIFHEQTGLGRPPYRTVRWGKLLQIWLVEGRDFRTAVGAPKNAPKTIWGADQIAWVERTLAASDAAFKLLITPTPMVGPDRPQKDDNYANAGYGEEGARLRAMLAKHKNIVAITGDRHWQYVSVDPATGLEEWSVGAASDKHAGGWNEDKPRAMHRFLRIKYGGFLSGEVAPGASGAKPVLTLRLHDVHGKAVFEGTK